MEAATDEMIALTERPDVPAMAEGTRPRKKRKKSKDEEEFGYDVDVETPFGKIEFALEPSAVKERNDQERREKAERSAAKLARKAAMKAEKLMSKGGAAEQVVVRAGGSKLVPIMLVFLLVAGSVAVAIWLFARPGEDAEDAVPAEFRNDDAPARPAAVSFAAGARQRISRAVRAGRQASREAQAEQERKFRDLTGNKK